MIQNLDARSRRSKRIRFRLKKNLNLRLSVFRSNKHIYAQLIDDGRGVTILSSSSNDKRLKNINGSPKEIAFKVGENIGDLIKEKKIEKKILLDRGCYLYHGRIKELALGVRSKGVKF